MSTQVQWKRGTTAENNGFTGAVGEITVDTTLKQLRLHDGVTPGGISIQGSTVSVNSATNLASGSAGQIPYQTGPGATSFFGPGTAGTVLVSYGASGTPTFQNTLTLAGTTQATSTITGALTVAGGVGVGGNLYVGGDIVANKLIIQYTTVTTTSVTTDDVFSTYNTTPTYSSSTGALVIAGGAGFGGSGYFGGVVTATNFYVNGYAVSTASALTIKGNGVSLGPAGILDFGTGTIVTVGSNSASIWVNTATLMQTSVNLANGTAGQIVYQSAASTTAFVNTATTGNFLQANYVGAPTWTTTANMYVANAVIATHQRGGTAGQLQYQSAVDTTAFVNTATTGNFLQANYAGAPTWTTTGSMYVYRATVADSAIGGANTATNLANGQAWQIPYQSAPGTTLFANSGTTGQFWQAATNGAPTWTSTSSIYVNSAVYAEDLYAGTAGQLVYQSAASATSFVNTATTGNFLQANYAGAPTWTTTANIYVANANISTNLRAGTAGQLHYQTAVDTSGFINTATTGNFLQANYAGAPTWTTTANIYVNSSVAAEKLYAGTAGQLVYQSAASTTAFLSTATTGNFLQANYVGAPTWTTTASMYVANAQIATHQRGGTAGQIQYQSAVDTTAFINTATTGNFLQANYAGAPTWTTTGSMYVYRATVADSAAGSSAQVNTVAQTASANHYLTFVDSNNASAAAESVYTTSSVYVNPSSGTVTARIFVSTSNANGTNFQVGDDAWIGDINVADTLRITGQQNTANAYIVFGSSNTTALGRAGTGGLTYGGNLIIHAGNTSTAYVGNAVKVETSLQTANASYYPVFVDANNSTAVPESVYTTSTFLINPGTGQVGVGYISTSSALTVNGRIESMTDPAGEGGQLVLRGRNYRWSFDNYYDTFRIIREDDVTETNGTSPFQISSGTTSVLIGYSNAAPTASGEKLGVTGGVYVNGILTATTIYGTFAGTIGGSVTINTATNIAGGTAGQLHYQSAPNTTAFVGTATTGNFLQANYTSAPTWISSGSMYVGNSAKVDTALQTANANYYPTFVDANNATAATESVYTTSSFSINPSTGLVTLAGQLAVNNTNASTTTNTSNALYVAGGAWISKNLNVAGDTTFQGSVIFQGTNTFVYSSSTVYTDNLISLHAPGGSGPGNHTWAIDDGKDIGFMFHYFKTTDKDAFLGFANDTSYLEWYSNGVESGGVFTGTTYGTFKTGAIKLVGGTANTGNTSSGDLTVLGGVGIGNNLYVAGNITVAGTINASITGVSTTATNIANGTAGQLVYQTAPGATSFVNTATTGNFLQANYAGAPTWTTTANIYVNRATLADSATAATAATNLSGGQAWQIPYQTAPSTTAFANSGTTGQFWQAATNGAPTWTTTANMYVANAQISTNIRAGTAGQLAYQSGANTTAFINTATTGNFLQANYVGAPTWTTTASMYVNSAVSAEKLYAGTAMSIVYQSAANTTAFLAAGSAGQILQTNGTGSAPTWVNAGTVSVGTSTNANALATVQQTASATYYPSFVDSNNSAVAYESYYTTSSFTINPSTGLVTVASGFTVAKSGTDSLITFPAQLNDPGFIKHTESSNTAAMQFSVSDDNGTTDYFGFGSSGALDTFKIWSNGTVAAGTWQGTSISTTYTDAKVTAVNTSTGLYGTASTGAVTLSLNTSTLMLASSNLAGGTAMSIHYQSAANTTAFLAAGTAGYVLSTNGTGSAPTWVAQSSIVGGSVANSVTFNNGGSGDASGTTYNGSAARTISYNTLGAAATGQTMYIGTTAVTINRTSGSLSLTGVSIDGSAGSATNASNLATTMQTASANYYLTFVDSNNSTAAYEAYYTTSTFVVNPASGNVGVGVGSGTLTNKFEVRGTAGQLFSVSDTFTGTIFSANDVSGIPSIEVIDTGLVKLAQYNGQVAISTGTAQTGMGLTVNSSTYVLSLGVGTVASGTAGEIRATNEVTAYYSDRRLKENVRVLDNAVAKVLSLHGITYNPNIVAEGYGYDRNAKLVGLFADEVESVLPEAIRPAPFDTDENGKSKSGENYKTIQYEKLVPLLIEAIKEQQTTINSLKSELENLKDLITKK